MLILVYKPRQAGDAIITSHCCKLLKDKYPEASIMFVTSPEISDMIELSSHIDFCMSTKDFPTNSIMEKEDPSKYKAWEWYDLVDKKTFEYLVKEYQPDLFYYPNWNPSDDLDIPYQSPYMFRCYANACEVHEFSDDTEYSLELTDELIEYGISWWNYRTTGYKLLLHNHHLSSSFGDLYNHGAVQLITDGSYTWTQSLAIISQADRVVTRYGGVAVMAAATKTPTVMIPKPEPILWASPTHSHPKDKHIMLLPEHRCNGFEGGQDHKMNPCQPQYGEFTEENCPLGRKTINSELNDGFHCWRDVDVNEVISVLKRIGEL